MSSIRKRGKNSWEVTVEQGYDKKTGRRKRIIETVKGKKRDAEIRRAELEQLARGSSYNYKKPEEITLEDYLPKYLKSRKSQIGVRSW